MKQLRETELKRFLREYRRAHPPLRQIKLLLQNVEYAINVGSVFRLADGADVDEIILSGITQAPPNPAIGKVARGKDRRIPWRHVDSPEETFAELRAEGYRICALELADRAVPYDTYAYPERLCLVVGHEEHGIPPRVLQLCDEAIFVPMYGKGLSLNVHVSLAVVCYHIRYLDRKEVATGGAAAQNAPS